MYIHNGKVVMEKSKKTPLCHFAFRIFSLTERNMPRYNGTGPLGFGPGTGWGLGPCGAGMGWGRSGLLD